MKAALDLPAGWTRERTRTIGYIYHHYDTGVLVSKPRGSKTWYAIREGEELTDGHRYAHEAIRIVEDRWIRRKA